jgi:tetratricopeptide (TPR) repeat protein
MYQLKKNHILICVYVVLIITFSAYSVNKLFFSTNLTPQYITKKLEKYDAYQKRDIIIKAINELEASILQLPKNKQRGLWLAFAKKLLDIFINEDLIVKFCNREISCWTKGAKNKELLGCYSLLGHIYDLNNKDNKAEKYLLLCTKEYPKNAATWLSYFDILIKQKKYDAAMNAIKKFYITEMASHAEIYSILDDFAKMNRFNEGIIMLEKIILRHHAGNSFQLLYDLGLEAEKFENKNLSLELYLKIHEALQKKGKYSDLIDLYYHIGKIYESKKDYLNAKKYYSIDFKLYPTFKTYLILQKIYKRNKTYNPDTDMAMLVQVCKDGNYASFLLMAQRYEKGIIVKKDMKKAIKWYKRAASSGSRTAARWLRIYSRKK